MAKVIPIRRRARTQVERVETHADRERELATLRVRVERREIDGVAEQLDDLSRRIAAESRRLDIDRATREHDAEQAERAALFVLAHPAGSAGGRAHAIAEIVHALRYQATDKEVAKMLALARGAKDAGGSTFNSDLATLAHLVEFWKARGDVDVDVCAHIISHGFIVPLERFPLVDRPKPNDYNARVRELLARCLHGTKAPKGVIAELLVEALEAGRSFDTTIKRLRNETSDNFNKRVRHAIKAACEAYPSRW